ELPLKFELEASKGDLSGLAFSADNRRLAAWNTGRLTVWDVAQKAVLFSQTLTQPAPGPDAVAFSPDGRRLAVGGEREVRFWDLAARTEQPALPGLADPVLGTAFSADGRRFLTLTADLFRSAPEVESENPWTALFVMLATEAMQTRPRAELRVWD